MAIAICDPDLQEKGYFFSAANRAREELQISLPAFEPLLTSTVAVYTSFLANYPEVILKRPIRIVYERGAESEAYIVGNEEFNKYGIGGTKEEALKDFEDNIVNDYWELNESSAEELTENARELLSIYREYI